VVAGAAGAARADTPPAPPGMEAVEPANRVRLDYLATTLTLTREIEVDALVLSGTWAAREDLELGATIGGVRTVHWVDEPDLDLGNVVLTARTTRRPGGGIVQALAVGAVIELPTDETQALDGIRVATYADPLGQRALFVPEASGAFVTGSHRQVLGPWTLQGDATLLATNGGDPTSGLGNDAPDPVGLWVWTQLEVGASLAVSEWCAAGLSVISGFPALGGGDDDDHTALRVGASAGVSGVYVIADLTVLVNEGQRHGQRTQVGLEVRW
jgi:hypothetical protein